MSETNTRELTRLDLDNMIAEGTVSQQHPLIQQLAANRIREKKSKGKEDKK